MGNHIDTKNVRKSEKSFKILITHIISDDDYNDDDDDIIYRNVVVCAKVTSILAKLMPTFMHYALEVIPKDNIVLHLRRELQRRSSQLKL